MWIQNCSLEHIRTGYHYDPDCNSMLIQIVNHSDEFPTPKYSFKEIYQFKFDDLEDRDPEVESCGITDLQAIELVKVLQHAFNHHMNVIVHCIAGICRSGAVAEVGIIMGFQDTESFREPNLRVKHKMMRVLGYL